MADLIDARQIFTENRERIAAKQQKPHVEKMWKKFVVLAKSKPGTIRYLLIELFEGGLLRRVNFVSIRLMFSGTKLLDTYIPEGYQVERFPAPVRMKKLTERACEILEKENIYGLKPGYFQFLRKLIEDDKTDAMGYNLDLWAHTLILDILYTE